MSRFKRILYLSSAARASWANRVSESTPFVWASMHSRLRKCTRWGVQIGIVIGGGNIFPRPQRSFQGLRPREG